MPSSFPRLAQEMRHSRQDHDEVSRSRSLSVQPESLPVRRSRSPLLRDGAGTGPCEGAAISHAKLEQTPDRHPPHRRDRDRWGILEEDSKAFDTKRLMPIPREIRHEDEPRDEDRKRRRDSRDASDSRPRDRPRHRRSSARSRSPSRRRRERAGRDDPRDSNPRDAPRTQPPLKPQQDKTATGHPHRMPVESSSALENTAHNNAPIDSLAAPQQNGRQAQPLSQNDEEAEEMFDFMNDDEKEQRLIEERRKKRQAILSKYQHQNQSGPDEERSASQESPTRKASFDSGTKKETEEDGKLFFFLFKVLKGL
jgi:hypothetical protein